MPHDLFTQVGLSVGLRRGAAALVFGRLRDEYSGFRVSVKLAGGLLQVRIVMPRWTLAFLGSWHLVTWMRARRIVAQALQEIAVPMRYRVTVETKTNGKPKDEQKRDRPIQGTRSH